MKIGFLIREKFYADVAFEVECRSHEILMAALHEIGEDVTSEELEMALSHMFGHERVDYSGTPASEKLYPAEECKFRGWITQQEEKI